MRAGVEMSRAQPPGAGGTAGTDPRSLESPVAGSTSWSRARILLHDEVETEPLHHPGGHRHLRRDLVALAVGGLFVAAALLKPWGWLPQGAAQPLPAIPAIAPSPTSASGDQTALGIGTPAPQAPDAAAAGADAPAAIGSAPAGEWGDVGAAPAPPNPSPYSADPGSGVFAVDWSTVQAFDWHTAWGAAAVTASPLAAGSTHRATPETWWEAPARPGAPITLHVPADGLILAIGVTWPKTIHPAAVTFEYLGPDGSGSGRTNAGQRSGPFLGVPLGSVLLQPSPPAASNEVPGGTMWVPPVELMAGAPGVLPSSPWSGVPSPWPAGDYAVRLDLGRSQVSFTLRLLATR